MYKPRDAQEALELARCWEKAQAIRKDPTYRFHAFEEDPTSFHVLKDEQPAYLCYLELWLCTCPAFEKDRRFCKHLLCAEEIARDAQMCMEYATMQACAETTEGCDPFSRY